MSTGPHSGIVYATMYASSGGTLSDGVQFSGVLIAPDEILTAAHCVTEANGSIRTFGTAFAGYDGATSAGSSATIDGVHVLDATHDGSTLTDALVSTDYAVLHLSQAISGATVFAMASSLQGGAMTVDGYPAATSGRLSELQETLTAGASYGEFMGSAIAGTGDSRGGSGGPVWTGTGGTPTVVGIASGATSSGLGVFKALTPQDIAQIDAWVYADHGSQPSATMAPSLAAPVTSAAAPVVVDPLDQTATLLFADADAHGRAQSVLLSDVATAFANARQSGCSGSDMPDATDHMASFLKGNSSTPGKAVAFMAGLAASESGAPSTPSRLFNYIANTFGLMLFSKSAKQAIMSGYTKGVALDQKHATAMPIGTSGPHADARGLAEVLASQDGGVALASRSTVDAAGLGAGVLTAHADDPFSNGN